MHDSFENMGFFVTDVGVVVYDPEPDVSPFVLEVTPQVTDKPIRHVIYSHHHRDHSQGAHLFPEDAILIAEQDTADFLAEANDRKRPQPDFVFDESYVLETGGLHGREVTFVIARGLRVAKDFVKAMAVGADAIAVSSAAMQAVG